MGGSDPPFFMPVRRSSHPINPPESDAPEAQEAPETDAPEVQDTPEAEDTPEVICQVPEIYVSAQSADPRAPQPIFMAP